MNRRMFLNSIASASLVTMTAGCISKNSVEYEFEVISLYDDISELDIPEDMGELPHIRKEENDIIIEGFIEYGDCSEPYVSDVYYTENKMNVILSTRSTKNILDKLLNPGCTLALTRIGFRITIPKQNKDIQSVNIVIKHDGNNIDKTESI